MSCLYLAQTPGGKFLLRAKKCETQQEERGEDPNEGTDLLHFSGANLDECEGKQAQAQSRRDAKREWRCDRRHECGESFGKVVPVHFGKRSAHERGRNATHV